jgi:aminotransferase
MTGWRVGYLHSDEKVTQEILKVHDALVTCAPVVSQYAAMGALEMGEGDLAKFKQEFIDRRDLICKRLDKLNRVFSYIKSNSSYFVFPKILASQKNSWDFALELLDKIQVAMVPGIAFGPSGEGHVRMSFGRSVKDINEAFDRMEKYFNNF